MSFIKILEIFCLADQNTKDILIQELHQIVNLMISVLS